LSLQVLLRLVKVVMRAAAEKSNTCYT
jgi:hypothetical protein